MTKEESIINYENILAGNDPLREMFAYLLNALMEAEANAKTGAEKGEHNPDRADSRSGYRNRRLDTLFGTYNLNVPKFRHQGYVPSFMTKWQRSEQALMCMIVEAWTNGVSTRKIKHLAEAMGIESISAGEVSVMNKKLDGMVSEFQNKQLEKEYPVMWIDAVYEKIRFDNSVKSMAVMIIKAIGMDGKVDIIAIEPMENESEETYTELFNKLKARGVEKVWLCVSDAHLGLQAAIRKCWVGSVWQRCKVHFMRNIMAAIPKKSKEAFGNDFD